MFAGRNSLDHAWRGIRVGLLPFYGWWTERPSLDAWNVFWLVSSILKDLSYDIFVSASIRRHKDEWKREVGFPGLDLSSIIGEGRIVNGEWMLVHLQTMNKKTAGLKMDLRLLWCLGIIHPCLFHYALFASREICSCAFLILWPITR